MRVRSRLAVSLSVVLLSAAASAQDCAAPEGATGGVSQQSAQERLAFLARVVGPEAKSLKAWTLGWGGAYGLLTVAQLAAVGPTEPEARVDWYVGAFTSLVGMAFVIAAPVEAMEHGEDFVERAGRATPENTCALIAEGERLVKDGAAKEAFGTAWYSHAANVAFNVAVGLFLWLGFDRMVPGLINFGLGTALGEGTIFSQPTGLVDAWDAYRAGAKPQAVHFRFTPVVRPGVYGLAFGLSF